LNFIVYNNHLNCRFI